MARVCSHRPGDRRTAAAYCAHLMNLCSNKSRMTGTGRLSLLVWLTMSVTFLTAGISGAQTRPPDFAIRFAFGTCTTDVLDTFTNVFVRDLGTRDSAITVPVTLTGNQLQSIYEAIAAARFFEYPSTYRVLGPSAQAPSEHYKLDVSSAGVSHSVSWHDAIRPSTLEADRLRMLFTTIKAVIADLPEVKSLPRPRIGCG